MNYRIVFAVNAIVNVIFGAAFLVLPSLALHFFGTTDDYGSTLLVARFMGGALVTIGLLLWFAKDANEEAVLKNLGYAALAGAAGGLIVTLIGTSSGAEAVIRSKAWIPIVLHLVFGLAYVYLLFLIPKNQNLS